jgi:Flp pilus assembly protein TadB
MLEKFKAQSRLLRFLWCGCMVTLLLCAGTAVYLQAWLALAVHIAVFGWMVHSLRRLNRAEQQFFAFLESLDGGP